MIRILRAKSSSIQELNRRKQNPLHLALRWPRGIQLLLEAAANYLVHQADVFGGFPITYAAKSRFLDAVQLLLDAGSALPSSGCIYWDDVFQIFGKETTIPNFILNTVQKRRRKLFELAKHTLPAEVWADLDVSTDRLPDGRAAEIQQELLDAEIKIPKSISVPRRRGTVYHGDFMTAKQADQLWDAGFKNIDSWDESGLTPLMNSRTLKDCQWLLQHGADLIERYVTTTIIESTRKTESHFAQHYTVLLITTE